MTAPAVKRRAPIRILPAGAPRDVWLAERAKGIGGSDVAAILGLDPFSSPLTTYWSKVAPDAVADEPSEAMEWGTRLEQVIADHWSQLTGRQVARAGLFAHPDRPWQRASIDRLVYSTPADPTAVFEAKNASGWKASEWADGNVPDRARLQLLHYLCVMDLPVGFVAGLVGGNHFEWRTVERDVELEEMLVAAEADFWRRVQERDELLADAHPATKDILGRLYEVDPAKVADLPVEQVAPLLVARSQAKTHIAEWEQRKAEAENRIRQLLGPCEVGQVDGQIVATWKRAKPTRTISPDLVRRYADVVDACTVETPGSRRLLVKVDDL